MRKKLDGIGKGFLELWAQKFRMSIRHDEK
jgi:hypothetical protein